MSGIIDWGYASLAKRLQSGRQPDCRRPQRGAREISQVFPLSRAISAVLSNYDPERFLAGGQPATIRGDRGVVSLQGWSPLTASSPLKKAKSISRHPRGGIWRQYDPSKSSSDVSSDSDEWSHSWVMRKLKTNPKNYNQQRQR